MDRDHGEQVATLAELLADGDPGDQLEILLHAISYMICEDHQGCEVELFTVAIDGLIAARHAVTKAIAAEHQEPS